MNSKSNYIEGGILRQDKHCRICNSKNIKIALPLKDTPIEDQFLKNKVNQALYPLQLALCGDCGYVFLPHILNPEVSYGDYVYQSSVTVGLRDHYDLYARDVIDSFNIQCNSFIVDLGSNDGSMLSSFKKLGHRVLGVEPAGGIAAIANKNGLPTINDFFSKNVAGDIIKKYGPATVVTANYMYANIDDVIHFTSLVKSVLEDSGIFVVQTGYHPEQMRLGMFDYIYHEHFSYFTAEVLQTIFERCGLELIDVKKTKPKGGSIRAVGQLKNAGRNVLDTVRDLIEKERFDKVRELNYYQEFEKRVLSSKQELQKVLDNLSKDGKKIVGFGASHSTTTLLHHFEIAKYLQYLVDDNPIKHGTFSPGHHLQVFPAEELYINCPDYVLLLAWQHQESIIKKHSTLLNKGVNWIVPMPELKIIGVSSS